MPQRSLTIRLASEDVKGIMRLQDACGCETPGHAVHASLQLFALIDDDLLEQIQAVQTDVPGSSLSQKIVMLLQEAVNLRMSHQEWKSYAKEGEGSNAGS